MNQRATPWVVSGAILALGLLGFMIWRTVGPRPEQMDKATIEKHMAMKQNKYK